jgi:hypothetical protein
MDTKKNTCYLHRNTYKTLDLNQDEMRLGGLRINPTTNSSVTYINNIKLRKIKENEIQVNGLPENPKSPIYHGRQTKRKLLFKYFKTGVSLWVVDVASAQAKQLTDYTVNANLGNRLV